MSTEKRDELLSKVDDVKNVGDEMADSARQKLERSQRVQDLAAGAKLYYGAIPADNVMAPDFWKKQCDIWERAKQELTPYVAPAEQLSGLVNLVSMIATNVSSATSPSFIINQPNSVDAQLLQKASDDLTDVVMGDDSIEDLKREMVRLGLDKTPQGRYSPLESLTSAKAALDRPPDDGSAASSALIGIREAIQNSLANLLSRRPDQERASSNSSKIESICRQCSFSHVSTYAIETLSQSIDAVIDETSEVKQAVISRSELRRRFARARAFMTSFLGLIDEAKLRKRAI